jgi:hypothetical protein
MKDLTGQKFFRLTVIEDTGKRTRFKNVIWLCQCSCGKFKEVPSQRLVIGDTKSCGCWKKDHHYVHGGVGTKLYNVWAAMKDRCLNLRCAYYKYYGGRGIKVCSEWREDFSSFRAFALAHGYKEGLTLDRTDNDGNYESTNVQFITRREHAIKGNEGKNRDNSGRFLAK